MVKPVPSSDFHVDIKKLRSTVESMDCLAQDGFSEISNIAKLALAQLETPDGYRHPEMIARTLRSIWSKADDIENCINSEAEQVGCNYVDDAENRRLEARRTHRQQQAADLRDEIATARIGGAA